MEHGAIITTNAVAGDPNAPSSPLRILILVASIAAGVQFGWALQLSLLTPYVQLLGVPHTWSSFIWLCGPLSGLIVQPLVGYYSDRCTARIGRRRPYIISGAALVIVAVFLIGFAADIGYKLGDTLEKKKTKPKAVAFFVVGFWILDVANNTLQGPCRALLADLSGSNHSKISAANAFFAFFMAVGNVLGYAAGSYSNLHRLFPFTQTTACDEYCANLKTCFIFSILLLITLTAIACAIVKETPVTVEQIKKAEAEKGEENTIFFKQLWKALLGLSKPMWLLFAVTALNWIGWFPFTLYDTDWMGREIYGGATNTDDQRLQQLYDRGVSKGSLGLMIYAVTLGIMSLLIEPLAKVLGHVKRVWGLGNFVLALCLFLTIAASKMAEKARGGHPNPPPKNVLAFVFTIFGILGIPQAVTFSIPFALASIYSQSSGAGQGLSLGLMNISICIPQMFVSLIIGPFDKLFGGGNLPGFVFGAISATLSGIAAFIILPSSAGES